MIPLVYLHGFASGPGSQKACWFRERFREIGLDLAVPDLAQGDFERLTITGQLGVVERVCAGQPVILLGSSMGGYLAALYGARHPEVEKLVLMAPAFGFARRWPETLGAAQLEEWKRTGFLEMYHYAEHRPARIHYGLLADAARYEDYPDLRQPVLIFHGARDETVPVRNSREFASARPNVHLEVLDSGHELLDVLQPMWEMARGFIMLS